MRAAAHVIATLVVAPYLALAVGFLLLGHVAAQPGLGSLLGALLDIFLWMVPWGLLGLAAALLALAALFFPVRTRAMASAALGGVSAASLLVILVVPAEMPDAGQILFLAPCVSAFAVAISNSLEC